MIFFHLRNKHNNRSATCYKAFKQHKLVILRSSSHIHCYGQVSITHGNFCISQGTQIMGRVMVGPTVKHMESCIWRSCGIIFFTQKIRRPCKNIRKINLGSIPSSVRFLCVTINHQVKWVFESYSNINCSAISDHWTNKIWTGEQQSKI